MSARNKVRVIIPDSHGDKIDWKAANAFLGDLKRLDADEIVMLGDHLDVGGTFNTHQRSYTDELEESYELDVAMGNTFLDAVQEAAPRAAIHYLAGNHEDHIERWAARNFTNRRDADMLVDHLGPQRVLELDKRSVKYYERKLTHMGLSVPGAIKLGHCYFTHGIGAPKHAAAAHVDAFGANVVFGHVHRSQSFIKKTVASEAIGGWCPGTLAKLQPLYRHTTPTDWTHGYGLQFVNKSGIFQHINVSIVNGKSLLSESGLLPQKWDNVAELRRAA